ncbi:uncharacterized protein ACN427_013539 [Glossina fuscipes fuscipes]
MVGDWLQSADLKLPEDKTEAVLITKEEAGMMNIWWNRNHDGAIICKTIRTAAHLFTPQSNSFLKRARLPWQNNTLSLLRKNNLWHRFKRSPDHDHLLLCKRPMLYSERNYENQRHVVSNFFRKEFTETHQ